MFFVFPTWLEWLERLGGVGLILLGLADNSPVPLPGSMDALTILLSAHQRSWWPYYASMATIGSLIGGYFSYALGREGGKESLEKKLSRGKAEKLYQGFDKRGFWTLFLPALLPPPMPYTPFLLAAGALRYPPKKFLAAVAVGRAMRYFVLAFLASLYGKQVFAFVRRYHEPILWTLAVLVVLGGVAGFLYARLHKRAKPALPDVKHQTDRRSA